MLVVVDCIFKSKVNVLDTRWNKKQGLYYDVQYRKASSNQSIILLATGMATLFAKLRLLYDNDYATSLYFQLGKIRSCVRFHGWFSFCQDEESRGIEK